VGCDQGVGDVGEGKAVDHDVYAHIRLVEPLDEVAGAVCLSCWRRETIFDEIHGWLGNFN
jgi:hypothetical protein